MCRARLYDLPEPPRQHGTDGGHTRPNRTGTRIHTTTHARKFIRKFLQQTGVVPYDVQDVMVQKHTSEYFYSNSRRDDKMVHLSGVENIRCNSRRKGRTRHQQSNHLKARREKSEIVPPPSPHAPRRPHLVRNRVSTSLFHALDHVHHRVPDPGAQVHGRAADARCSQLPVGEANDTRCPS